MQQSASDIALQAGALTEQMLNARAWISVEVSRDIELALDDVSFITGFDGIRVYGGRVVDAGDLAAAPTCYQVFEPVRVPGQRALRLREAHSRIRLHGWGDPEFSLLAGCTRATLIDDDRLLQLRSGDVLLFEQVLGAASGLPADADPQRRHAVRLSRVEAIVDPLDGRELLAVEWHAEDRLPFALPVAGRTGAGAIADITVMRGNVVLADHGRTVQEALLVQHSGHADGRVRLPLSGAPLTLTEADTDPACAAAAFKRDPLAACTPVSGVAIAGDDDEEAPPAALWQARPGFDASGPEDRHFVVQRCADGHAELLFGDGCHGARLRAGTVFIARYRVGQAAAGCLGREALAYMVLRGQRLSDIVIAPRNPLPARRCVEAASSLAASDAPVWQRAACYGVAAEFAAAALRHPCVRQAAAWRSAAGEGHILHVVADVRDSVTPAPTLRLQVEAMLAPFLPARHALQVAGPARVPIALGLRVRLQPGVARARVLRELVALLGERETACGQLAFFHRERRKLGQPVYAGSILALAASVNGVDSVVITRLARLDGCAGEGDWGVVDIGPGEIAVLDADGQGAERGTLDIDFSE